MVKKFREIIHRSRTTFRRPYNIGSHLIIPHTFTYVFTSPNQPCAPYLIFKNLRCLLPAIFLSFSELSSPQDAGSICSRPKSSSRVRRIGRAPASASTGSRVRRRPALPREHRRGQACMVVASSSSVTTAGAAITTVPTSVLVLCYATTFMQQDLCCKRVLTTRLLLQK